MTGSYNTGGNAAIIEGARVARALLAMRRAYRRATQIAARPRQGRAFLFGLIGLRAKPSLLFIVAATMSLAATPRWQHLSSKTGDLPVPGESTQQTGVVVADFDQDGLNDFVLSFRQKPPALVWYRRARQGWTRQVIEQEYLTVEAGGAVHDIDSDGDLDLVFGGDWQSQKVWWWENPYPQYDPAISWKRHTIKDGGEKQHHDQIFGDFLGTGKAQLAFWNQGAKKLFLAEIPHEPRTASAWTYTEIFSGERGEGIAAADIDGDGKRDLLAGSYWFKHSGGSIFKPVRVASNGGLIAAARLKAGRYPQIVISSGDGVGPLMWYECAGDPSEPSAWVGHDLAGRDVVHGHSLQIADIDQDGNLDVFCAEMAKWTEKRSDPDNPGATAWIFYGDGKGGFTKREFATGFGFHEARVADLDGDGDHDVLDKPYNWEVPRIDVWLQNGTGRLLKRSIRKD